LSAGPVADHRYGAAHGARLPVAPFHDERVTLINYRGEYACFFSSVI